MQATLMLMMLQDMSINKTSVGPHSESLDGGEEEVEGPASRVLSASEDGAAAADAAESR